MGILNCGMRGHDVSCGDIVSLSNQMGELGVRHIQFAPKKSFKDINWNCGVMTPGFGDYIKGELAKNNVRVSVLGCYINPVHPDPDERRAQLDWFKANLKFARYIGADMVGTETGHVQHLDIEDKLRAYDIFEEGMRELVECAEKYGVTLGVEPVTKDNLNDVESTVRFVEEMNSPNLSVIFDPVNMIDGSNYTNQNEIIKGMFRELGDKIDILHLKDFKIENGEKVPVLACSGMLNTDLLFDIMREKKPFIDCILETTNEQTYADTLARVQEKWMN